MQVLYALTAGVAGYVASLCYKVMGGTNWVRNVLLTTALFCGPMLACFSFLNTVAIIYRVSGTPFPCPFDMCPLAIEQSVAAAFYFCVLTLSTARQTDS